MFPTNNDREESCIREGGTYSGNVCATPRGPAQPDFKPDIIVVMFPSLPVDGRSADTIRIASYNSNSLNRCVTWPLNVAMRMIFRIFRFGNKENTTMSQLRWGEYCHSALRLWLSRYLELALWPQLSFFSRKLDAKCQAIPKKNLQTMKQKQNMKHNKSKNMFITPIGR